MYIDVVVASGLLIVFLTCAVTYFIFRYAKKHIEEEDRKASLRDAGR